MPTSTSLPPFPRRPRPSPPPLFIHLSATINSSDQTSTAPPHAAYGLYITSTSPPLRLRISHTLNPPPTNLLNALLAALLAALHHVHPYNPRLVRVISDYEPLSQILHHRPDRRSLAVDSELYDQVEQLLHNFHRDKIVVQVEFAGNGMWNKGLSRASQLARQALTKHAFCRLCQRSYVRTGKGHACRPVCLVPPCGGTRFESVQEYERHVERRHPIARVFPEGGKFVVRRSDKNHTSSDESSSESLGDGVVACPQCRGLFKDFAELAAHVERQCPQALEAWMDHTIIVKE